MDQGNLNVEGTKPPRGLFRNINSKLIAHFCLLFLIILAAIEYTEMKGVPFTPYIGEYKQLKAETFRGLNLIAEMKKERLLRWVQDCRNDVYMLSSNEFVVSTVVEVCEAIDKLTVGNRTEPKRWALVDNKKSYHELTKRLRRIKSTSGVYNRIQIADAKTGMVFVSTDEMDLGANISGHPCFSKVLQSHDEYIGEIDEHQGPVLTLHFSHIIKSKRGEAVAVLLMEVNAEDTLKPMLHTGDGLGKNGEAILVCKKGRILTSLKHPLTDGTIAKPLEYRIKNKLMTLAASGKEGTVEAEDYRREPVLAAYRYIRVTPEWGWGLVVKRDQVEVFAPLHQSTTYTLLILLAGFFVFAGLTIVLSKQLTRPILSLSCTADKVTQGDLDARAAVTTSDEVGALAATFNAMIERIQNSHKGLEERVKARTAELTITNEQLGKEIAERNLAEEELLKAHNELEVRVEERTAELAKANQELRIEVTERKRAEEVLKESEEKYRRLVKTANDAIFIADVETGIIIEANKVAAKLLGLPVKKIIGMHQTQLHPKEEAERYRNIFQKHIQKGEDITTDIFVVHKDGYKIPVEISASITMLRGKKIIQGIFRDTRDRTKQAKLARENIFLKQSLQKRYKFSNIVGVSPQMYQVFEAIERLSKSKSSVLITGESGTGKELVARAIHYNSPRAGNHFVALNCGAIPENLLESELFGHLKGAFTGAVNNKQGLFEEAHGGSLFLDEIGELSFNLQSKLLRVLQEGKLKPVGSAQERAVDVRIIAATNKDLEAEVSQGLFRRDLFYRLAVVPVHLSPLRERKEDIPLLVKHLIDKIAKQNDKKVEGISTEALETLINYPWEGNVRELGNVLEYAIIFSGSAGVLQLEDLPLRFKAEENLFAHALYNHLSIEEYTKTFIQRHESQHTETSIANMLGITPKSLWEKRKKWGIPKKKRPAGNKARG